MNWKKLIPNVQQLKVYVRWGLTYGSAFALSHGITTGQWTDFSNGIYAAIAIGSLIWGQLHSTEASTVKVVNDNPNYSVTPLTAAGAVVVNKVS